jgi:hypothetical protein
MQQLGLFAKEDVKPTDLRTTVRLGSKKGMEAAKHKALPRPACECEEAGWLLAHRFLEWIC